MELLGDPTLAPHFPVTNGKLLALDAPPPPGYADPWSDPPPRPSRAPAAPAAARRRARGAALRGAGALCAGPLGLRGGGGGAGGGA